MSKANRGKQLPTPEHTGIPARACVDEYHPDKLGFAVLVELEAVGGRFGGEMLMMTS